MTSTVVLLGMLASVASMCVILACQVYGTVLCFKKSWVCGLAALVVPMFAVVVAIAKIFNKDLLN